LFLAAFLTGLFALRDAVTMTSPLHLTPSSAFDQNAGLRGQIVSDTGCRTRARRSRGPAAVLLEVGRFA